jgi:hypothetical protein
VEELRKQFFFEKRTKKLSLLRGRDLETSRAEMTKVFGFFFSKKKGFFTC